MNNLNKKIPLKKIKNQRKKKRILIIKREKFLIIIKFYKIQKIPRNYEA